jgi:hypothetical protein
MPILAGVVVRAVGGVGIILNEIVFGDDGGAGQGLVGAPPEAAIDHANANTCAAQPHFVERRDVHFGVLS